MYNFQKRMSLAFHHFPSTEVTRGIIKSVTEKQVMVLNGYARTQNAEQLFEYHAYQLLRVMQYPFLAYSSTKMIVQTKHNNILNNVKFATCFGYK